MSERFGSSGWMRIAVIAALIIGLLALGLAAWPLLRPGPSYDATDIDEARDKVCAAHDLALRAVKLQTNQVAPPDPGGAQAVAANARLALVVASQDLAAAVDAAPAAPEALRDAASRLSVEYRGIASNYLAGLDNAAPAIAAAFARAENSVSAIDQYCAR